MSLPEVKKILVRAATDPDFRKKLFENPEIVLANYDLTIEEKQAIEELDEEKIAEAMRIESSKGLIYSNDIRI